MKKWSAGLQASELKVQWRRRAYIDLQRLYDFLAIESEPAAYRALEVLLQAVRNLQKHPRLGSQIHDFRKREVRKLTIGNYELRYELKEDRVIVLRFWHGRENR